MTGPSIFVDTNVLLYTLDAVNREKHEVARSWRDALWASRAGRLSWQVLNEFYSVSTAKLRVPAETARQVVQEYWTWKPLGFSLPLLRSAWGWMDSAGIPYWDSLILAAAELSECSYLLSEDFQQGRRFATVTVVNPFRSEPAEFGLG